MQEISIIKPKIILSLGVSAFFSLSGEPHKMADIRGQVFHFSHLPPVFATVHPSFILRSNHKGEMPDEMQKFEENLRQFLSLYQSQYSKTEPSML